MALFSSISSDTTTATATPTVAAAANIAPTVILASPTAAAVRPGASASPTLDPEQPLAGRRIGIDPGHGPRDDLGAVSVDPDTGKLILSEAEFNLDVAKRCRDILATRGAEVMLTRENADTFTAPWPNDANGDGIIGASGDDLQTRVDILNDFHAEVFLSIHANSLAESKSAEDLQIIYCGSDCPHPTESKRLGDLVLDQLTIQLETTGVHINKGAVLDDLDVDSSNPPLHMFVLGPPSPPRHVRSTSMPGVLGETLYVSQPAEASKLLRDDVRQAIALGYANALQEYLTGTPAQ
ncbi:MAG TPA: N-acetylmuramoyl-L-alanine amidase [Chloroflexia bacterium]|nr:N-acetylmuramoyl-L-alanine amidase [Chloroflexia bacterium]